MNNQTYRITLNAAALLPLAQGKLECVNLINWYPARYYPHDSDPPFAELKLYQRAFCSTSARRIKAQLGTDRAVLTFRLPTGMSWIMSSLSRYGLCRSAGSYRSATAVFHTAPAARISSIPIPMRPECLFTFPTSRRASCA